MSDSEPGRGRAPGSGAVLVAAGIALSRVLGFVREAVYAYFFGVGPHKDVLDAVFRAPNLLQNLLGEGTVSASFIPIYSRMLAEGREREAGRFAGAVFGLLLAVAAAFVLLGVALAEPIVTLFAPGFREGVGAGQGGIDRFALAVTAVRIVFPMTGILVLSAWALGVLNSHRRFFLPYVAPVLWNVAIIAALFALAGSLIGNPFAGGAVAAISDGARNRLVLGAAAGALVGGLLQLGIQLPLVARVMTGFRLSFSTRVAGVRQAISAFGPVVMGRGVYQLLGYLDLFLATLLAAGAVGAIGYALRLYLLPVALFGLSVAAAELPELSRLGGEALERFLGRVGRSVRQMSFLTLPTVVGYLAFGYLAVAALYRRGEFGAADNWLVYLVLGGFSAGILATTLSRLMQNSFYALGDTRTPAKIAVARVVVNGALAYPLMRFADRFSVAAVAGGEAVGDGLYLGAVGLALASAAGAWVELALLQRALGRRLGRFGLPWAALARMAGLALAAALPAGVVWWRLPPLPMLATALVVIGLYAALYLGLARLTGAPELAAWLGRLTGRRGGRPVV